MSFEDRMKIREDQREAIRLYFETVEDPIMLECDYEVAIATLEDDGDLLHIVLMDGQTLWCKLPNDEPPDLMEVVKALKTVPSIKEMVYSQERRRKALAEQRARQEDDVYKRWGEENEQRQYDQRQRDYIEEEAHKRRLAESKLRAARMMRETHEEVKKAMVPSPKKEPKKEVLKRESAWEKIKTLGGAIEWQ